MLTERITNQLNIMPENFYLDTLRPTLQKVLETIHFDPILVDTAEEVMNKADGYAVGKKYNNLKTVLTPLSNVVMGKNYYKTDSYIRADEDEKVLVRKLSKDLQDMLTILTCTEEPAEKETKTPRQRVGYDSSRKENVVQETYTETKQRPRIPNYN